MTASCNFTSPSDGLPLNALSVCDQHTRVFDRGSMAGRDGGCDEVLQDGAVRGLSMLPETRLRVVGASHGGNDKCSLFRREWDGHDVGDQPVTERQRDREQWVVGRSENVAGGAHEAMLSGSRSDSPNRFTRPNVTVFAGPSTRACKSPR